METMQAEAKATNGIAASDTMDKINQSGDKAVEATKVELNELGGNLETAVKDAMEQIRHCDEQAALWQEKKHKLQTTMNETLNRIQKQFNGPVQDATEEEKKTRIRVGKNATVPVLIRSFLEKNGPTRTKDIRKFLLAHGKKTNPGVALSRMVKSNVLKHAERGVYKIA